MENNIKVREELWESVNGLSDEQLNEVVEEGKWTIVQVLEHLYLLEKKLARWIQNALLSNASNATENRPIHLAVNRTHKIEAPKVIVPSNEFQTMDQLKIKLADSREALINSIKGVSEDDLNKKSLPHPTFGFLSLNQWVSLIGFHEQRHIGQIEEIKESLKK